ncbi:MAG: hypothetical protein ABL921_04090 [Pirellula sp.]
MIQVTNESPRLIGLPFVPVMCMVVIVCSGCGDSTSGRGRVQGKVTIDGVPLAVGQIRFFALTGGIGADGNVTDGVYDIPTKEGMSAGTYRVELSSTKTTGRKVPDRDGGPGDTKDEVIESLPAKFNQSSTIQIEFDPKTPKSYDFDLKK